ncbi:MAG: hypothetical protein WC979_01515 [Candidatus Pacearchaeota archaeon]|jgi:hypothetical protein|nr:hypothetical protein [Clostridia bacterium]
MNTNTIKDWLKNQTVQKTALLVVIFIMSIFIFKGCGQNSQDKEITRLKQNITAQHDSIIVERNKAKEIEYKRGVLAAENGNLKTLNKGLSDEVNKEKGKVIYITKLNAALKDSIAKLNNTTNPGAVDVTVNKDGTQTVTFNYDKIYSKGNEHIISGSIDVGFLQDSTVNVQIIKGNKTFNVKLPVIDKNAVNVAVEDEIHVAIVTGLERDKKDNTLRIFVRSDYPGFVISELEGAIIDPQKDPLIKSYFPRKRFVVGPQIGFGISTGFNPSVFIGIGLTYKIFEF